MKTPTSSTVKGLFLFLSQHNEEIQNAVLVLEGRQALDWVQHLLDHLCSRSELNRGTRSSLTLLRELLSLKSVGEPNRIKTDLIADVAPCDPRLTGISGLIERFENHLRAVGIAFAQSAPAAEA